MSVCLKPAQYFYTWSGENFVLVRGLGQFGREILPGEVELFVEIRPPFGAIGYVINDSVVGDQLPGTALTIAAAQFHVRDDAFRNVHRSDYTGIA